MTIFARLNVRMCDIDDSLFGMPGTYQQMSNSINIIKAHISSSRHPHATQFIVIFFLLLLFYFFPLHIFVGAERVIDIISDNEGKMFHENDDEIALNE